MADDVLKKRYRSREYMALGDLGPVQRGELVDSGQVAQSILDELLAADDIEYVDTVKWVPEEQVGRGAWVAQPEPDPAQAAADKALVDAQAEAAAKQPAGPPATKKGATSTTTTDATPTDPAPTPAPTS